MSSSPPKKREQWQRDPLLHQWPVTGEYLWAWGTKSPQPAEVEFRKTLVLQGSLAWGQITAASTRPVHNLNMGWEQMYTSSWNKCSIILIMMIMMIIIYIFFLIDPFHRYPDQFADQLCCIYIGTSDLHIFICNIYFLLLIDLFLFPFSNGLILFWTFIMHCWLSHNVVFDYCLRHAPLYNFDRISSFVSTESVMCFHIILFCISYNELIKPPVSVVLSFCSSKVYFFEVLLYSCIINLTPA